MTSVVATPGLDALKKIAKLLPELGGPERRWLMSWIIEQDDKEQALNVNEAEAPQAEGTDPD